jgi:hypothetical protein
MQRFLACSMMVGALGWAGCSSIPTETETSQVQSADGGSAEGEDGGAQDKPAEPKCADYCDAVTTTCGGTFGEGVAQYPSKQACMEFCDYLGNGSFEDEKMDTVGCRLNRTKAAATDPSQCAAAGPTGNGVCNDNVDPPENGGSVTEEKLCRGFCFRATQRCIPENGVSPQPFANFDDCMEKCGDKFKLEEGALFTQSGNTLNCRQYYLVLAMESEQKAVYHCPHLGFPATANCR